MAKPDNALTLGVNTDLSEYSLESAVFLCGASFVYDLWVSAGDLGEARKLLRQLCAQYVNHPFSPYFNLHVMEDFKWGEWQLQANDKVFWSSGA